MKKIWTQEQERYLLENYELVKTKILISVLKDKTNDQIRWKAKSLNLKKKVSKTKTDGSFLENFDNPESLYWWGFLTADGCFTDKQIIFSLEKSDDQYVKYFAEKAGSKVKYVTRKNSWHIEPYTMARTVINDKFLIKRLADRLKIVPQKTYNPFDVSVFLEKNRLCYYLAGIIDGDGHIELKDNWRIRIKVHKNWKDNFDLIKDALKLHYNINSTSRISTKDWLEFSIYRKDSIKILYNLIKDSVPIMARKWARINQI